MCHGGLVNLRGIAQQQLDEGRQIVGHLWRTGFFLPGCSDIHRQRFTALAAYGQHTLHNAGHVAALMPLAGTLYGGPPTRLFLTVIGQEGSYPVGIVVAHVAHVAGHGEDEVVASAQVRLAAQLLFQCLDDVGVRDVLKSFRESGCVFGEARITRIARIFMPSCFRSLRLIR